MNGQRGSGGNRVARLSMVALAAGVLSLGCAQAGAAGERSGKEVVDAVCAACHATGANGAPRIGDSGAWSARASQGLTSLTRHALDGIRQMPPHGGNPGVSDLEIERAITYMVNESGGHWAEPIDKAAVRSERSGEQVVRLQCSKCHEDGLNGAPRIGDRAAWIPRLKSGVDVLVRSAINGHGGMPARGGMADLTDLEIRDAIVYMFSKGSTPPKTIAARAAPGEDSVVVGGVSVYLGIIPAEMIRSRPGEGAEARMHGGVPPGSGVYHVMVALFDRASGQRITDAVVSAQVRSRRGESLDTPLDSMTVANAVTYGNYFRMPDPGSYGITVFVNRPGNPAVMEAQFRHMRP